MERKVTGTAGRANTGRRRRRNSQMPKLIAGAAALLVMILVIIAARAIAGNRSSGPVTFAGSPPGYEFGDEVAVLTGSEVNVKKLLKNLITDDSGVKKVRVSGRVKTKTPGTYMLTARASDTDGNTVVRNINVIVTEPEYLGDNCWFITGKGFLARRENGITSIDGTIVVNKTYSVPEDYGTGLTGEMQEAFGKMADAAASDGLLLTIVSGFRSYETQTALFQSYADSDGIDAAETYSAHPGHSEHQIGEAADINDVSSDFARTEECRWLQEHAYEYGFVLRYPENKTDITGYIWEPWHYRYAGTELAEKLYNGGDWITFEEYFGIDSKYREEQETGKD